MCSLQSPQSLTHTAKYVSNNHLMNDGQEEGQEVGREKRCLERIKQCESSEVLKEYMHEAIKKLVLLECKV